MKKIHDKKTADAISTHTPHAGRNIVFNLYNQNKKQKFQLTRPMRGATPNKFILFFLLSQISTHTPHAGRNLAPAFRLFNCDYFNSHAPCGAQHVIQFYTTALPYFNSHAPCGAQPLGIGVESRLITFQLTRPMRGATGRFCFRYNRRL